MFGYGLIAFYPFFSFLFVTSHTPIPTEVGSRQVYDRFAGRAAEWQTRGGLARMGESTLLAVSISLQILFERATTLCSVRSRYHSNHRARGRQNPTLGRPGRQAYGVSQGFRTPAASAPGSPANPVVLIFMNLVRSIVCGVL